LITILVRELHSLRWAGQALPEHIQGLSHDESDAMNSNHISPPQKMHNQID